MATLPSSTPQSPQNPTKRNAKKRTGTTRGRTGCLTCRQRRKKCEDNTYPVCGQCKRLNLDCVRESPRVLPTTPDIFESQIETASIPDALQISTFALGKGLTDRRYLMKYYTSILTNLCTTNHENNSFLSVFLPMAMDSPMLLSSLIAWSSAHLASFNPSYELVAVEKQSLAFASVANSLASNAESDTLQEPALASCLVLCSVEVAMGDTSRWQNHLAGAKNIISHAKIRGTGGRNYTGTSAFMTSQDGQFLLRHFAYHDIIGSVTTGEEPLIKGDYWCHDSVEVVDAYMGVASRVLVFVSEASCLSFRKPSTGKVIEEGLNTEDAEQEDTWQPYQILETKIQEWTCPAATQSGLISMAYAYRSAALIHLYRRWRKALQQASGSASLSTTDDLSDLGSKMSAAVEDTMHHISEVRPTSLPECGLLFPLFMAGGETVDPVHIEIIVLRLKTLLEHRGFRNVKRAIEVLEELWRLKACGMKNKQGLEVDWMDVLQHTGTKLLLT